MIYPRSHDGKPEAAIRSRLIDNGNGLGVHVLESGFESGNRPCLLLLHGFPEIAYSWRKLLPLLAAAGFHVVAPDQRGYGRTTGWDDRYDGDLASFHLLNLVKDTLGLVRALRLSSVASLIGHDFGSPVAAWCALLHPQVFRSAALLSAPFGGPPGPASGTRSMSALAESLAALQPPRKHYQRYFSTSAADADMRECPQGIEAFLRAYFHVKSADWKANLPHPLTSWAAAELAKMPGYYIMDFGKNMPETVAELAPSDVVAARCAWLTDDELHIYGEEFARTSFRGGLKWYRNATDANGAAQLHAFAGRRIEVPCCFIAGKSDWGTYQSPGALQAMESTACSRFDGVHLIDGAGHWVQQEQPAALAELLVDFVTDLEGADRTRP